MASKALKKISDITVEWVVAGWDVRKPLLANISAGDPVDNGANNNPKFALKGISQPLNDFVNLKTNLHIDIWMLFLYNGNYFVAVRKQMCVCNLLQQIPV